MIDSLELARIGAKARLLEIAQEREAITAAFPGILDDVRKAKLRQNIAKARMVKAAKREEQNGG